MVAPAGGEIDPRIHEVDLGPGVRAGFTARHPGGSSGAWAGLDLALHVGDDPGDVARNRAALGEWAGTPVRFMRQVHGDHVLLLDADGPGDPLRTDLAVQAGADALVTARAGLPLGVLVADCVPVLLADPVAGVVAAVHAGRRGLLAGVLQAAVAQARTVGALPTRMRAVLGPAAGGCCYEVPAPMRDDACRILPTLRATTTWGTPSLDLRAGCRTALAAAGVEDVTAVEACTVEDETWYSYRRTPVTGRFAGVVQYLR